MQSDPNIKSKPAISADTLSDIHDPAAQDAAEPDQVQVYKPPMFRRFKIWYLANKKWTIAATIALFILTIAVVPFSRYHIAGLVLKQNYTLKIIDSTTGTPVSAATVRSGKLTAQTNGSGQATLRLPVGLHSFSFSKKYYRAGQAKFTVPIFHQKATASAQLVATGRQVKISVVNLINKKPLANVDIAIAGISAKTDKTGAAVIVLPTGKTSYAASLGLGGYNDAKVTVKLSNVAIENNKYGLTPSGKVYYLSKLRGTLDVTKANLDGTNPETVLTGTGSEQTTATQLLRSADQKYIALLTQRSAAASGPQLYIISTSDDRLLSVDSGNANFAISGWSGDSLVYTSTRRDLPAWQPGLSKIKAYNAQTGKTITIDQSTGSDAANGTNEIYDNVFVVGSKLVFSKYWSGDSSTLNGKQDSVQVVGADGQNQKTIASYDATKSYQRLWQYGPAEFYIALSSIADDSQTYYGYTVGSAPQKININGNQLYNSTAYYFSPSGSQTFWSEPRDGKNSLIIGDSFGGNQTTIAKLSDYDAAGWYGSQYLLLSKGDSELYIMAASGGTPVKIASYQATSVY